MTFVIVLAALAGVFLGLVAVGGVVRYFSAPARSRRQLRASPTVLVAHLAEGQVATVAGTVEAVSADHLIESLLSGRKCCLCAVIIQRWDGPGRPRELKRVLKGVPFWVRDESGRVLVVAAPGTVNLAADLSLREPTPGLRTLLEREADYDPDWLTGSDLRFWECVLLPGERVTVRGVARKQATDLSLAPAEVAQNPGHPYRESPALQLVFSGADGARLLLADEGKSAKKRASRASQL